MSENKKKVRQNFRDSCLTRDKYSCVMCGLHASSKEEASKIFDIHHICDRSLMPFGGFVKENGITLCHADHLKAEEFHSTGVSAPGFSPEDLYQKIGSSKEKAIEASKKIG